MTIHRKGEKKGVDNEDNMKQHDNVKTVETNPVIFIKTIFNSVSIISIFMFLTYFVEKFLKVKKDS